ncbi:MAG: ThiF family adenylyltransferase [Coriobacteriales bacterium]|jgi:tRNA A37 threonylcarbamoyladenosine dehydratase
MAGTADGARDRRMDASRTRLLVGEDGLDRLAGACVVVAGVGGVGSNCAESLARCGVGTLVLVDGDVVSASNANRQAIAFSSTVGAPKVEVMAAMARDINPGVRALPVRRRIGAGDAGALLDEVRSATGSAADFVVDALDSIVVKLALAREASLRGVEVVSSMGAGNKFDPTRLEFADLFETSMCPMCRAMRKQARARGIDRLRVLYSRERAVDVPIAAGGRRGDRSNIGTMGYMPAIMGQLIAADVVCALLGLPRPGSSAPAGGPGR